MTNTVGVYETKGGETLAQVALEVYGLASERDRIAAANAGKLQEVISDAKDPLPEGLELVIPELDIEPLPAHEALGDNHRFVRADVAHLEGRKLLQQPVDRLAGVSGESAELLAELGVRSIFDLALSRTFNGVRELVDGSGVLASEFTKHDFIPRDLFRGDPSKVPGLAAFLSADLVEVEFHRNTERSHASFVSQLKSALPAESVRDLALWPPFRAARRILESTFNPYGLPEGDPEAPADLLPKTGNFATERVQYSSVVMNEIDDGSDTVFDLASIGPIELPSGAVEAAGALHPAEGAMLTTEQAWFAQGVTLGQLLHSLALGPGESTRIAMVDWTRRTSGSTSSTTSQIDRLAQSSAQARSISEITNAIATESQHGASRATSDASSFGFGSTTNSSASLGLFGTGASISNSTSLSLSRNSSVATNVGHSRGDRRLAASTSNNVAARTRQHATAARSRRATIVQETFEEEKEAATTRVITNYNHMHALSIQYYEVVQVYRVRTQVVDFHRVLFVPMKTVNFNDPSSIERYRTILWRYAAFVEWSPGRATLEEVRDALDPVVDAGDSESVDAIRAQAGRRTVWQRLLEAYRRPTFRSVIQRAPGQPPVDAPPAKRLEGARMLRMDYSVLADDAEIEAIVITSRIGTSRRTFELSGDRRAAGRLEFTNLRLEDIDEIQVVFPGRIDRRGDVELVATLSGYEIDGGDDSTFLHDHAETFIVSAPTIPGELSRGTVLDVRRQLDRSTLELDVLGRGGAEVGAALVDVDDEVIGVLREWFGVERRTQRDFVDVDERLLGPRNREDALSLLFRLRETVESTDDERSDDGFVDEVRAKLVEFGTDERAALALIRSVTEQTRANAKRLAELDDSLADAGVPLDALRAIAATRVVRGDDDVLDPQDKALILARHRGIARALRDLEARRAEERDPVTESVLSVNVVTKSSAADDRVRDLLLRHLNEHALFYSQAIWLDTDPMELSRALVGVEHRGEPVGRRIDPTPVAVTGNYLGFRWMFETVAEKDAWMEANSYSLTEANAQDDMVPLPTGGVFAEAVQGRFNAAEKLDLTRFWDWQDSPIPIVPPGIQALEFGSRARTDAPSTDGLDAPGVRLPTPQSLPDPTGVGAALSAVTASNLFRDMSGLSESASLADAALKTASAHAQRAAELTGEGAQHAAEQAVKAMELGMEHQRKMAELALEAAPLIAAPATGGASLAAGGASKAGAVMNMAAKLDASSDDGGSSKATGSAFASLLGKAGGLLGKLKR